MPGRARTTARDAWQRGNSRSSEAAIPAGALRDAAASGDALATPDAIAACAAAVRDAIARGRPVVVACDATLEGVLAATGVTYLAHAAPGQVRLAGARSLQPQLGEEVVRLPDATRADTCAFARRVLLGFATRITGSCRRRKGGACPTGCDSPCVPRLVLACASDDPAMPEVVHRYLRLGFAEGPRVREMIADPRVAAFDALARRVLGECEHARQFVRFSHMSDGSYLATFSTSADVVPLMAAHFAARMGTERFCLVDPRHRVAAFHEADARACTVMRLDAALAEALAGRRDLADDEPYVRAMWRRFYRRTTTPGRGPAERGYDLRLSWMPRKFWDGLTELDEPDGAGAAAPDRYGKAPDLVAPLPVPMGVAPNGTAEQ